LRASALWRLCFFNVGTAQRENRHSNSRGSRVGVFRGLVWGCCGCGQLALCCSDSLIAGNVARLCRASSLEFRPRDLDAGCGCFGDRGWRHRSSGSCLASGLTVDPNHDVPYATGVARHLKKEQASADLSDRCRSFWAVNAPVFRCGQLTLPVLKIPWWLLFGLPEGGGGTTCVAIGFLRYGGGVELASLRGLGELLHRLWVKRDDAAVLRHHPDPGD